LVPGVSEYLVAAFLILRNRKIYKTTVGMNTQNRELQNTDIIGMHMQKKGF
jgi:hypothetical protein